MNEERLSAYQTLIYQLLNCVNGEEGNILQDNAELVDIGFCLTMKMVAETLAAKGQPQEAEWLLQLAQELMVQLIYDSPSPEASME